ncbi:MAG: S41 family peptidase [Leptospirales bacterium]|nr:S41 family peptidase [Leptospirales bacterium]
MILIAILIQNIIAKEIPSELRLVREVKTLMTEHYYDRSKLPAIIADLEAIEKNPNSAWPDELKRIFDDLQVSHIGLHTPDEFKYYELLDVFRFVHADKLKAMYPPDGIVRYPGIGILSSLINERYFVALVFADTPAAQADILPGDELVTVDDQEYSPIKSFRGKVGRTVKLTLRREQNGPLLERKVIVKALNPTETFVTSTAASARVIEHKGLKFGYIRLYCFTNDKISQILVEKLSGSDFSSADALILDLRGRLGGAPLDTAEIFVGGTPKVESISPTGEIHTANFRWNKPLVAIIGPETRSGMEIIAYSLKKAGLPLVGTTTKGAVMGGTTFVLSDGSLLEVPCMDVKVDGMRLEGIGVVPTVYVDAILEYSQGSDPQLEAAVNKAMEIVGVRQ